MRAGNRGAQQGNRADAATRERHLPARHRILLGRQRRTGSKRAVSAWQGSARTSWIQCRACSLRRLSREVSGLGARSGRTVLSRRSSCRRGEDGSGRLGLREGGNQVSVVAPRGDGVVQARCRAAESRQDGVGQADVQ
jgi:hypothetical protein